MAVIEPWMRDLALEMNGTDPQIIADQLADALPHAIQGQVLTCLRYCDAWLTADAIHVFCKSAQNTMGERKDFGLAIDTLVTNEYLAWRYDPEISEDYLNSLGRERYTFREYNLTDKGRELASNDWNDLAEADPQIAANLAGYRRDAVKFQGA